ncbi:MAG: 3-hydroxyacyl-ACP dehydratase FabZ [Eubacteriaceae bacterium]|jgi:3-hydroxyacyl-[acyl-carrier-protein] dehydratase|nr:3-hydroxyacyl-ACP dehydratase FabZ [Eubacteriaceae bacterium]
MKLNSNEIQEIIPHRYPFLLVDAIEDGEAGVWARGRKSVSAGEPVFTGHFPEYHVMPGVLIIEALAQVGAIAILSLDEFSGKMALFGGIKNAKFRKQVRPGDVLTLNCEIIKRRGRIGIGKGIAKVGDEVACEAELTFVIQ